MKFLLIFGLSALIQSIVAAPCKGIVISNRIQDKEVLKTSVPSPYQLAIDRDTNTLFFSYTANTDTTFKSVYINLKDKSSDSIPGVEGGFANAVDNQNQIVYIGGGDGIYKFDYNTKRAVKLDITDKSIWQLFFKDGLYFTSYPEEKAYVYKDGVTKLVPGLEATKVMLVAVDKNDNIYFAQGGELKTLVNGVIVSLGDYNLNAFNTDADGNLYFSTPEGVYRFVKGAIEKVTSIDNMYGFAVEGDGSIIYAAEESIVRLKPTQEKCDDDKNDINLNQLS